MPTQSEEKTADILDLTNAIGGFIMLEIMNRNHNHQMDTFNPFREMEQLERSFFGDPFGRFFDTPDLAEFKTDVTDEGDYYMMEADLPGFDKKDIHLELQGDNLIIQAERHSNAEEKNKDGKVVRMERSYGSYSRSFNVSQIDTDHMKAAYDNGVLKLTLPKMHAQLPESRAVEIE